MATLFAITGPSMRLLLALLLTSWAGFAAAERSVPQDDVMMAAAHDGNVDLFRAMLKEGASITAHDASGDNALTMALLSDDDRMINEVLSHRPDLNVRGGIGFTPLGLTVERGNEKAFQRLLKAGADVDRADASGATPLLDAIRLERAAFASALLEAGADPNQADRNGITALHAAAEHGEKHITQQLLAHGAEPNVLDREQRSALFIALLNGHPEIAEILLRDPRTDPSQIAQGYASRFWAAQFDQPQLVELIDQRLK